MRHWDIFRDKHCRADNGKRFQVSRGHDRGLYRGDVGVITKGGMGDRIGVIAAHFGAVKGFCRCLNLQMLLLSGPDVGTEEVRVQDILAW